MPDSLRIGDTTVHPGTRQTLNLPIAHLYTHTEMTMPVHVVHGKKTGPCLFVIAAIHGDEINGVEIVRRLLKLKLLRRLRGTLIAIPIVNVYGFIQHSRYLPDRRDLNRSFPGSHKGSLASHLAHLLMEEIVDKCTHGIDLHAGSNHRDNLPQVRASLADIETERLAKVFGAPVIIDARLRDGSLREAVTEKGIPMLLYEGGEALRFDEVAIHTGLHGILAVMREIGLLSRRAAESKRRVEPLVARSTSWVRAPASGILVAEVRRGAKISKNQVLGAIGDPFGEHEEEVRSPVNGVVVGCLNLPLVHKGDALFHLASFEKAAPVEMALEAFEATLPELEGRVL